MSSPEPFVREWPRPTPPMELSVYAHRTLGTNRTTNVRLLPGAILPPVEKAQHRCWYSGVDVAPQLSVPLCFAETGRDNIDRFFDSPRERFDDRGAGEPGPSTGFPAEIGRH